VAITWYPALEVGVQEVDDQHRELFRRVDALVDAIVARHGPEEMGPLFDFLGRYAIEHFTAEEALMRVHGYPQRADHEVEHQSFVEDFAALRREFNREGATALLLVKVNARVVRWLVDHISGTDKELAAFLKAREGARAH
jgi:hemerythrin